MSFDTLNQNLALVDGLGNKWIRGKVIANVDPKNMDRIQADAPGLFDSNLGPVPWIGPVKISPFGFGDGYGVFGTPAIGSDVAICLQDGDPHYPLYMHIQCFPSPSEFPSGTSWGFKDPNGNKLVVTGKDIQFESGGGLQLHIDQNGSYTLTVPSGQHGTYNVDNVTFNSKNFTVNADSINTNGHLKQTGVTQFYGDTSVNTGTFSVLSGVASFASMVTFLSGIDIIGTATANGHNIGETHTHFNQSGVHTGIVYT